jgi:hypothetical protein
MDEQIETVHIIFKTHLDVGFTDMPHKVVEEYFNVYIPQAIQTARFLRQAGGEEQFIWTLGSWLIVEYLEKALPEKAHELEDAIQRGDITWHAYAFSAHHELMSGAMLEYELGLSRRLDQRFGKHTRAAKLTDVPGDTSATLPHLARVGVRFLHIGVNKASSLPDVPAICLWQDNEGSQVVLMYHSGYGNVMDAPGGGDRYAGNVTHVAGMKDAIFFAFTLDNHGPQTPESVKEVFAEVHRLFPGACVIASTMDAYADKLWEVRHSLPVVSGEIGNTWIHGGASDPKKLGQFRALSRLRQSWLEQGKISPGNAAFDQFSRWLLLVPEHTWGINESAVLNHDRVHWNQDQLAAVRSTTPFQIMEESWREERAYITKAVDALAGSSLADEARVALAEIEPKPPALVGFSAVDPAQTFDTGAFQVGFDPNRGAINHLLHKAKRRAWAAPDHLLGLFRHQSFDEADWRRFFKQYIVCDQDWVNYDFGKPDIDRAGAISAFRPARLEQLYLKNDPAGVHFIADLSVPEIPPTFYGVPRRVTLEIDFPAQDAEVRWNMQWFGKRANRLPEACWFSFSLWGTQPEGWRMEKIDRLISPLEVVSKGGRNLHGVNRGVFYHDERGSLALEALDAGVVAPGEPKLLDMDDQLPDLDKGWHFNLWNNKWGCNFPTWYEDDARFRFVLQFSGG